MSARVVTDSSFEAEALSAGTPILVDFWAEWCGPCKMMTPIVDGISADFEGSLTVVKVNIDENPGLVEKYSVKSVPTFLLISDGKVVKHFSGPKSKPALIREISQFL